MSGKVIFRSCGFRSSVIDKSTNVLQESRALTFEVAHCSAPHLYSTLATTGLLSGGRPYVAQEFAAACSKECEDHNKIDRDERTLCLLCGTLTIK
jgi:hypothetical protein